MLSFHKAFKWNVYIMFYDFVLNEIYQNKYLLGKKYMLLTTSCRAGVVRGFRNVRERFRLCVTRA